MRSDRPSNIGLPICSMIATAAVATLTSQGQVCDNPISATRDKKQSAPDVSVWVLRCENNSYRVRLAPDMAARIQRLK